MTIAGSLSVCSSPKSAHQSFNPSLVGKKTDYAIYCNIDYNKQDILFLKGKYATLSLKQNDHDGVKLVNFMKNSIDMNINDGLDSDDLLVISLAV